MQATQIALPNHHIEKLEVLQSVILNSVIEINLDDDEIMIFLYYVDTFTR